MIGEKRWRRAFGCILVLGCSLVVAAPAGAQDPQKKPPTAQGGGAPDDPPSAPGARPRSGGRFLIGDAAPDVNLPGSSGTRFHLATERRTKPWLLVFVRRPGEVTDVDAAAGELAALGLGTAVIAPFGADRVGKRAKGSPLMLLFDRASMSARTFGVYDALTGNPRPGAFLVDRRGRFVWMISGGLPSAGELVRMTREAMETM